MFDNYESKNKSDYYEELNNQERVNNFFHEKGMKGREFTAYQQEIIDSPWYKKGYYKNVKIAEAQQPNSTVELDREI